MDSTSFQSPTERFSNRADVYSAYRPTYPADILEIISENCQLDARSIVADIGSGTGIFTSLLLETGCTVFAVEPNKDMRTTAESKLGTNPRFQSVRGTAEDTGLEDGLVQLITVAQAFHWFQPEDTKTEFRRILSPGGYVCLIWNQRDSSTKFGTAYETFLRENIPAYVSSHPVNINEAVIREFFKENGFKTFRLENQQSFDRDGLFGRFSSSSYSPSPKDESYTKTRHALEKVFDKHAVKGKVSFDYDTQLFLGTIK